MILQDLIKKGKRPDRPADCIDEVWDFMKRCWAQDASHRPSFTVIAAFLSKQVARIEPGIAMAVATAPSPVLVSPPPAAVLPTGPTDAYFSYCWPNSRLAMGDPSKAIGRCDPREANEAIRDAGFTTWLDVERLTAQSTFEDSAVGIKQGV